MQYGEPQASPVNLKGTQVNETRKASAPSTVLNLCHPLLDVAGKRKQAKLKGEAHLSFNAAVGFVGVAGASEGTKVSRTGDRLPE